MSQVKTLLSETLAIAKKHGVIPDVIDSFQNSAALQISYGSKQVQAGQEYTVAETQELPKVEVNVESVSPSSTYTLILTDPDAPRRGDPTWSEFAHYLATDIKLDPSKSNTFQPIDFSKARELISYMGPGPPPKTGLHRYVFLLYEGATDKKPTDRPNWGLGKPGAGVREWLQGQSLTLLGVNFFEAQNTDN